MTETSGAQLRRWLLLSLGELDGSAPRSVVHAKVEALFGSEFTAEDRAARLVRGVPREPAWRNNLDSLYDRLKKTGHLRHTSRGDPWELSGAGRAELLMLSPVAPPRSVDTAHLLSNFSPGDGSDYLARVRGAVLLKSRTHEVVLDQFGRGVGRQGWRPITSVYPRDLELRRGTDEVVLAEVKVVYNGNSTQAVREATSQLLEYRYFFYDPQTSPWLMAVFSEPVGMAHVHYLTSLRILSTWRTQSTWEGSIDAQRLNVVPLDRH